MTLPADPRLFAVLLGGTHPNATLELHDVQFVVARDLREAYPWLRGRWFGDPDSVHLDAFAEILQVDGYAVRPVPRDAAPRGGPQLFFVNTGGYEAGVFNEAHRYSFHVGADKRAVWQAARAAAAGLVQPHKDNFFAVDDVVAVADQLSDRWGLALVPAPGPDRVRIVARYDKMEPAVDPA